MDDGSSFYIENNGFRSVPKAYAEVVKQGGFVDPELYYFCTKPNFEIYDTRLEWLTERLFVCCATRLPEEVRLGYYTIEL